MQFYEQVEAVTRTANPDEKAAEYYRRVRPGINDRISRILRGLCPNGHRPAGAGGRSARCAPLTQLTGPSQDKEDVIVGSADRLVVKTSDGRQLEAIVSGPAHGLPLVFHSGTPMGLVPLASFLHPAQCGLRTVLYARPGYAASSPHPGRSVADAVADTEAVPDAIGADRFVTLGWSGGGPHALACAALLADRCLAAAVVAGDAPFGEAPELYSPEDADWNGRVQAGNDAEVIKLWEETLAKFSGARAESMADNFECTPDRESMSGEFVAWMAESFRAAFASGIEGCREDWVAFDRDWGFKVAQARRVAIWHGAKDQNVPVARGAWLGNHIPNAELHVLPDEGHVSIGLRFREIFDDLVSRSQKTD
jgi:pimeloyl-ACP methyl ester carboxylesterase